MAGLGGTHGFIGGGMRSFILGACMVLFRGCAWLYLGGACMVLFGGHAWFYLGVCMVLFGGMHGFIQGGHAWFFSVFSDTMRYGQ